MKIIIAIVFFLLLSFPYAKGQDTTAPLFRKDYFKLQMIELEEQAIYLQILVREKECTTKTMYWYETFSESQAVQTANQNKKLTIEDSIENFRLKVETLKWSIQKMRIKIETAQVEHISKQTKNNFNMDMHACLSFEERDSSHSKLFFTFFKEHNRELLGLFSDKDFQRLSPQNFPNHTSYWHIPIDFMMLEKLEPVDNIEMGNAKVSDFSTAFKNGTIKFTSIRRVAE
jgi:hypothetical protein